MDRKSLICLAFLILLLAAFVSANLLLMKRYRLLWWDEAVYLGIGKFIYSNGKSGLWEPIRPVGLPILLGVLWLRHLDYAVFAQYMALALSALCIFLTYILGRDLTNSRETGLIAALLLAITPVFFHFSSFVLTEIPSTLFALIAVYFVISRKSFVVGGAFAAFSFITKFTSGILVAAVIFYAVYEYAKKREAGYLSGIFDFIVIFLVVTSPYLYINYLLYSDSEPSPLKAAVHPFILAKWHESNPAESIVVEGNSWSYVYNYVYYLVVGLREQVLLLFAIVGAIALLKWMRDKNDNRAALIFFSLIISFAYFSLISNKQVRFLNLLLPYMCIFAGYGIYISSGFLCRIHKAYKLIFIAVIIILIIFSCMRDFGYYASRGQAEPAIVKEVYSFFPANEQDKPILTADPVFAAYTDHLLVPFYYSVSEGNQIIDEWFKNGGYSAIVFYPEGFYCGPKEPECPQALEGLWSKISESNKLVLNNTFYYQDNKSISHYVFLPK